MYFLCRIVSFKKKQRCLPILYFRVKLIRFCTLLDLQPKELRLLLWPEPGPHLFFYQIRIQPGLEKLFRSYGSRSATLDVPLHVAAPAEEVVIERVAPLVRLIRQLHLAYLHTHNTERLGIQKNTKKISKSQKKTFPPISPFTEQI